MTTNASGTRCGVCRRPLRNPFSITVGVGPTCAKKLRRELNARLVQARESGDSVRAEQITSILRDFHFATTSSELHQAVLTDVRNAYRENARTGRRPSATPVTIVHESLTRGRSNENIRVEWINRDTAYTYSESGNRYETTSNACSCPDFVYRGGSYNQQGEQIGRGGGFCRHMFALSQAQREVANRRQTTRRNRTQPETDDVTELPVHTDVNLTSRQTTRGRFNGQNNVANLEVEATTDNREVTLRNDYNEYIQSTEGQAPIQYVDYVNNDETWNQLQQEAYADTQPINLEEPLFRTSQTWGVEIETHFPNQEKLNACLQELYREGFIHSPTVLGYHSSAPHGYFKAERDGSITGAGYPSFEFVTPKLTDTKEDKERFLKASKILEKHGAFQTRVCGTHVTLDQTGLSQDPWAMQRFARTLVQNEHLIAQVASGDMVKYKTYGIPKNDVERSKLETLKQNDQTNNVIRDDTERMAEIRGESIREAQGSFRHGTYTAPFARDLSFGGNMSIDRMRSTVSPNRYSMVSFRDSQRVEFRVNQGVNGEEILRKARFYDSLKAIGRDIRNESEGAEHSAKFSERDKHLRINGNLSQYNQRIRELCSLVRDKNVAKDIIRLTRMGRV